MNRYQSPIPRAALAFLALGLTALTVGMWVIAPATMEPGNLDARAVTVSSPLTPVGTEAVSGATRIDVVAVRKPTLITVLFHRIQAATKHKQQS